MFFVISVLLFFLPFFISDPFLNVYKDFNKAHGMLTSFIKFSVLATLGEIIGLRIKSGVYYKEGFGVIPRAIVWGFLGLSIKMAFVIFAKGTPIFLSYLGVDGAGNAMAGELSAVKVGVALAISVSMNLIFAPLMMTLHKITDLHIISYEGKLSSMIKPIAFGSNLRNMDWDVQWNFVFKKTIPFFWIPAHTITFLLPPEYQVLFAAFLGIVLGILLALASLMGTK